jgi:predicted esterase
MTSKSWQSGFGRVCAISLLAWTAPAQEPANAPTPAIASMDAADAAQWQNWVAPLRWQVIAAEGGADKNIDLRLLSLGEKVQAAIKDGKVDASRVYLAGRGDAAAAVFYAIARMPDLWAAAAALGGSPKPAIDTGRLFAANFTNVPVLWISGDEGKAMTDKLAAAGIHVEWQSASSGANAASVFQWLARHKRDEYPSPIDCETLSPQFARCYWIQMTKFDAAERNDVLPSTRMPGSNGAALDLGGFGWKTDDPGPGILVSFLPEKYPGPLKMQDRIVALDGKAIENAKAFQDLLDKVTEESHAVATVQRGKDRIRIETRFVVPRRDANVSARVQAEYLPAEKTIQIISRTVTEMRVNLSPGWVPAALMWNGLTLEQVKEPGCWTLTMQKEILHAERCR